MKTLFIFSILTLFSSLFAEAPKQSKGIDLKDLEDKKIIKVEKTLDYESLIEEMVKIKKQKNTFRAEIELKTLSEQVMGKRFLLQDTVMVKRNALVSRDYVFWFKPSEGIETKLILADKYKKDFERIKELDHIAVYARLVKVDRYMHFEFIKLKSISPFNPKANFVDFNKVLEKNEIIKNKTESLSYDSYLSRVLMFHKNKIGHVTGKVESLDSVKGKYYMTMRVNGKIVNINCIPDYIDVLAELDVGSQATMSVYLDRLDDKNIGFIRGVLINLKK